MRILTISILALGTALAGAQDKANGAPLLLRAHFAGAGAVQTNPEATRLKKISELAASQNLKNKSLTKFGTAGPRLLEFGTATNLNAVLEPLAADFWQFGGVIEVHGRGAQQRILVATVLPAARQTEWNRQLAQLRTAANHRLAFAQEGKWTIVGSGSQAAETVANFQKVVKTSAPALADGAWLHLHANLPLLAPALGLAPSPNWPILDLDFTSKADDVRATGTLSFAQPITWRPEPWHIPTSLIKDPLVSFCALNGASTWLSETPLFAQLAPGATPNQVFGWSQSGMPLLLFAAAAANSPTNLIGSLASKLPAVLFAKDAQGKIGEFLWISNRAEILWQGLPIMMPHVKAIKIPEGSFVHAELFPNNARTTNAPPELFSQVLGKSNLVYYDWEITEHRTDSWRQMFQLLPLFLNVRQVPTDFPGQKWIQAIAPLLGNTITEVTYVSPTQMKVVRRGPVGLTGYELVQLARALDLWNMPGSFGKLRQLPPKAPVPAPAKR